MGGFFSKRITEEDLLDLRGKVAIVTGGSSGIGLSTVQWLVQRGAKVYMAARSEERAKHAISQLEHEGLGTLGGKLEWLDLDLSHPKFTKKAAEVFLTKEKRLDILGKLHFILGRMDPQIQRLIAVNNAAVLNFSYTLTEDGIVDMMVVNPYTFTEALVPLMKATAAEPQSDVRIVYVSSTVHSSPTDLTSFKGKESLNTRYGDSFSEVLKRYGLSKLANILHGRDLQRRFDAENIDITCISLHPGVIASAGSYKTMSRFPLGTTITWLFFSGMRDGAMASALAAAGVVVANNKPKYKGSYLVAFGEYGQSSKEAEDPRLASELCATTDNVLREMGV